MQTPWTDATALELARKQAPLYGLVENQLPTQIYAGVLNGIAECEAILASIQQQETPVPAVQHVPEWLP
jgi:hypothetical protein